MSSNKEFKYAIYNIIASLSFGLFLVSVIFLLFNDNSEPYAKKMASEWAQTMRLKADNISCNEFSNHSSECNILTSDGNILSIKCYKDGICTLRSSLRNNYAPKD